MAAGSWPARYASVRAHSQALCAPLAVEDYVPQPMADVSPPKWHLGHTSWFFEAMVLQVHCASYTAFHPHFAYLFNSYYEALGERVQRIQRGALSRPTVAEVLAYRAHVDAAMLALLHSQPAPAVLALTELGLQHEQQHQELLLADIKYILGANPLHPSYDPRAQGPVDVAGEHARARASQDGWISWPGGLCQIGHEGPGFAYDNESARHLAHVPALQLRAAPVSNAEYAAFIADAGYQRHEFWQSEGWDWVRAEGIEAPLYWQRPAPDAPWQHYTLAGLQPLPGHAPVSHVSYFEADAFCQWAGWRLPTEFEWEALAGQLDWGQRWEWTQSAYLPYPGFRKAAGATGEYNGKFMVNQMVLRGASFATPQGHGRTTYRNFFHAPQRWQYTGLRPAR
ncbi:MAG: ergothioneine biosynthesis EgtB family protein [Pseudomonadota bacterium]|jgi:ergothioneine biosynthesis protein EgtB